MIDLVQPVKYIKCLALFVVLFCGYILLYVCWREDLFQQREARLEVLASRLSHHILSQEDQGVTGDEEVELGWLVNDTVVNTEKPTTKKPEHVFNDNVVTSKRSTEYCNPMYNISHGVEGKTGKLKLVNVHIIIRHGDRSPIYSLPNYPNPTLSCQLADKNYYNITEKYLSFVSGVKNSRLKLLPSQKSCEGSQLTPRGFLQHVEAGRALSKVYITKRNLFDNLNESDWDESIYVRSTHYSRTYQSAWAFLYGFLSNITTGDKINMITESYATNFCSPKLSGVSCNCAVLNSLEYTLGREHYKIVQNHTYYKYVKETSSKLLGISVSSVPWIGAMLDVLMAYKCHNKHLPCISKTKKCFTSKMIQDMWTASDSVNQLELKSPTRTKYDALMMHPLMREMANRYVNITKGTSKNKLVLYSGHDKTLTPLTVALGINDGKWPPYASRLVLELYKSTNSKFYLRAVYNGKDVTKKLRFCDNITKGLCPLKNYINFVFNRQLSVYNKSNTYKDVCTI